jgi:superfamily II DNA or RNA helicase
LIGEGFDCKNLSSLYLTTPIKFSGRVLQYIGRVMRPGNERPRVFDFVDWDIPALAKSARGRIRVYGKDNVIFKGE